MHNKMSRFLQIVFLIGVYMIPMQLHAAVRETEVIASIEDPDIASAQSKAKEYARKRAFFLTLSSYDADNALKIAESMTDQQILAAVRGMTLLEDKYVQDVYYAKFNVGISEEYVEKLLTPGANPEMADEATVMLVLPVLQSEEGVLLWENNNIWRSIWNSVALSRGDDILIMPFGDPTDRLTTESATILNQGFEQLSPMLERYGAQEIIIPIARFDKQSDPQRLLIQVRRYGEGVDKSKSMAFNTDKQSQTPESLMPMAANNVAVQMIEIARNYDGNIERKLANANKVPIRATFRKLSDWSKMQTALREVPGMVKMDIGAISIDQALLTVYYSGTRDGLMKALKPKGVIAQPSGEDSLILEAL